MVIDPKRCSAQCIEIFIFQITKIPAGTWGPLNNIKLIPEKTAINQVVAKCIAILDSL